MAQLNITLNQDEILLILQNNPGEGMRQILEKAINSILKVESANQLNAEPYERNEDRTDSRNGTRARNLNTRIGRLTLNVPRHRNVPFKTVIFENYSRSEAALVSTMAEMVVNGVSTRKVSKVIETLCGTSFSKSSVSEVCKDLDEAVQAFQNRPLTGNYPFLTVDATYFKVREKGRIISKAFMTAYAINEGGLREVIGFGTYPKESQETWRDFLAGLKKRGLTGLLLITSDAHEGLRIALNKEFPQVPWQRCQFHFSYPNLKILKSCAKKSIQKIYDNRNVEKKALNFIYAFPYPLYFFMSHSANGCISDSSVESTLNTSASLFLSPN